MACSSALDSVTAWGWLPTCRKQGRLAICPTSICRTLLAMGHQRPGRPAVGGRTGASWLGDAGIEFQPAPVRRRRNPYVYAHTSSDVLNLAAKMEQLARLSPEGHAMVIHVVTPENYWPLPWYLRSFNRDHVGYWWDAAAWQEDQSLSSPVGDPFDRQRTGEGQRRAPRRLLPADELRSPAGRTALGLRSQRPLAGIRRGARDWGLELRATSPPTSCARPRRKE